MAITVYSVSLPVTGYETRLQPTWQFSLHSDHSVSLSHVFSVQSYSLIFWPLQDTGFKYRMANYSLRYKV